MIGGPAIFTFATGHGKYVTMAKALAISLELQHCQIPRVIVTDSDDPEVERLFDVVLRPDDSYRHFFTKLSGLERTEFDRILFIDGDSLAVRPVEPIFEAFSGSDFAVQGRWTQGLNWYGDMAGVMKKRGLEKIPIFSGGLLYYERTENARRLIARIIEMAESYDSLGLERNGGHVVDEVCISLAMAESGIGTVVPDAMQLSFTPWSRRNRVRLDVLRGECDFIKGLVVPRLVRPIIYHSAHAKWDALYWREVRKVLRIGSSLLGRSNVPRDKTMVGRHLRRLFVALRFRNPENW